MNKENSVTFRNMPRFAEKKKKINSILLGQMLRLCPVRCQTHSITIMWENQSHFSYLSKNNTRIWSAGGWKQKPFLELRSGIFDMNQTHSWWVEAYALCKYNYHQCIKQLTCTFNCSHRHNTATRCLTARTTGWLNDFFHTLHPGRHSPHLALTFMGIWEVH